MISQGKKYHYMISRHPEGTVAIQDGTKFSTVVELIQYHTKKVDGLLTTLKRPCFRAPGQPPQGYRFITLEEMQRAMREAALQLGYQVGFKQVNYFSSVRMHVRCKSDIITNPEVTSVFTHEMVSTTSF